MKEWNKPNIETLAVENTSHNGQIKWDKNSNNWCKWDGTKWTNCEKDYQPTQDDIIISQES